MNDEPVDETREPVASNGAAAPPIEELILPLFTSTRDYAVLWLSTDGTIQGWYGAAQRLFGHTAEQAIGQPGSLIFTPEDLERGMDRQEMNLALTTGRSEDERWHRRRDAQRFWGSGVMTALHDDAGAVRGLCKIVRDRTDMRAQVEALEHRVSARDAELQRRNAFFASTVHELRNPLGPLAMALELLQRELTSEMRTRAMAVLDKQIRLMTTLVEDLSQGVHLAAAQVRLALQPVPLGETLRQLVDGQQPRAAAARITIRLVLPSKEIHVHADPRRLEQMLLNLVGNALKYTRAGGHVNISASVEADMAVVRIEDDGIGIAPDVLPHIFELFTREGRDRQVQGLGIGLAVVQQLAGLHNGNVEVRSPGPGKGSSFALRLPLAPE